MAGFLRRRKSCPFSGKDAPRSIIMTCACSRVHLGARQDRAVAHHRGLFEEAA